MAIAGALAAAARVYDPWPDFDEVYDFAGVRNAGRRFFKLPGGRRVPDLRAVPSTTFTRATEAIATAQGDVLQFRASGEPAIGDGRGIYYGPSVQNVCTNYSYAGASTAGLTAQGTGVFSRVARADLPSDVRAALEAVDPGGRVTHLTRVVSDGTVANQGCICLGDIGVLTPSTLAVRAFVVSGGTNVVLDAGSSPLGQTALLSNFQRTVLTVTPDTTSRRLRTRNISGSTPAEWYFFANSFTATAYAPPEIAVAGAAATRNADVHLRTALPVSPDGLAVYDEGTFDADGTLDIAWQIGDGTNNNRYRLQRTTGNVLQLSLVDGGVNFTSISGPTTTAGQRVKVLARYEGGVWDLFAGGVKYTGATAALPPGATVLHDGGNHTATAFRKGYQAAFAIRHRGGLNDAAALALTAP